jgi:hypothetical protein
MRRQEVQMHPCWYMDLGADMPAGTVEHQDHLLARPCADRLGKFGKGERECGNRHGWQQQPPRPAGAWMHEAVELAPLVAMLHHGLGTLAARAPDAAQDGCEANTVLGGRPQRHRILRIGLLHRLHYGREVCLKAACAMGSACAWRGRGTFEVHPKRRSTSHPR